MIERFLTDIEKQWRSMGDEPIVLKIIGSTALFLQTDYVRGTKDTDFLQIHDVSPAIWDQLKSIAGKGTPLANAHRLYIDLVPPGLAFLPGQPAFHLHQELNEKLSYFQVQVLDIHDVIVSKLKTFRSVDLEDLGAMVERDLLDPKRIVERFELAKEQWLMGSRAEHIRKCIANLHTVQRDYLFVPESAIDVPNWVDAL